MKTTGPDHEGLLRLLPRLKRFPDAMGETTLTATEAAEIRALGFQAGSGRWNIPFIPFEFVRDTVFEWTAARQPRAIPSEDSRGTAPQMGKIERDAVEQPQQVSGPEGLSRFRLRMIRAVERAGGRIPKRHLQQKFWRTNAKEFNTGLTELINGGLLRVEGKLILLSS